METLFFPIGILFVCNALMGFIALAIYAADPYPLFWWTEKRHCWDKFHIALAIVLGWLLLATVCALSHSSHRGRLKEDFPQV